MIDNNIYSLRPGDIQNLKSIYQDHTILREALIFEYLSHGIHRTDVMNAREMAGALLLSDYHPYLQALTEEEKHTLGLDERPELLEAVKIILEAAWGMSSEEGE